MLHRHVSTHMALWKKNGRRALLSLNDITSYKHYLDWLPHFRSNLQIGSGVYLAPYLWDHMSQPRASAMGAGTNYKILKDS